MQIGKINISDRCIAILRETVQQYLKTGYCRCSLICALALLFLVFFQPFIATKSASKTTNNFPNRLLKSEEGRQMVKLEDSIASANEMIDELNQKINMRLQQPPFKKEMLAHQIGTQERLLIKKLETLRQYARIPVKQFNQIPVFSINNETTENQIEKFNQLQLKYVQADRRSENAQKSLLIAQLQNLQSNLINTLNKQLAVLKVPKKISQEPKRFVDVDRLLAKRDCVMFIYTHLMVKYQRSFNTAVQSTSFYKPSSSIVGQFDDDAAESQFSRSLRKALIISLSSLLSLTLVVPFIFIYCQKYRQLTVVRQQDISCGGLEMSTLVIKGPNGLTSDEGKKDRHAYQELGIKLLEVQQSSSALIVVYSVNALNEKPFISRGLIYYLLKKHYSVVLFHLEGNPNSIADKKDGHTLFDFVRNPSLQPKDILKGDHQHAQLKHIMVGAEEALPEEKEEQEQKNFWTIQRLLLQARTKELLRTLKEQFDYVIIDTSSAMDFYPLILFVPFKNVNINIIKKGVTSREDANTLCRLTLAYKQQTINILSEL